jgi:secreted Zn-dependent insulinase-like peptidase
MPRAIVQLFFFVPGLVDTPLKRVLNAVLIDILIEKVSKQIGYEANLADVNYSMKVLETNALKLKFKGYNDKLPTFIVMFAQIMHNLSQKGLEDSEEYLVYNALEKVRKEYTNQNVEICRRDTHNRLSMLYEHQFHAEVLERATIENRDVIV